jgi:hypothetical protein
MIRSDERIQQMKLTKAITADILYQTLDIYKRQGVDMSKMSIGVIDPTNSLMVLPIVNIGRLEVNGAHDQAHDVIAFDVSTTSSF